MREGWASCSGGKVKAEVPEAALLEMVDEVREVLDRMKETPVSDDVQARRALLGRLIVSLETSKGPAKVDPPSRWPVRVYTVYPRGGSA